MTMTTLRNALVLLTMVGCGSVTAPDAPAEDPTEEPGDEPGDEPTDPPGDEPTDEPTDPPGDEPTDPPEEPPAPITEPRFLGGSVRDERSDVIEFWSGEPVHAHVGPPIALTETGCATIYKYGYLLDREPAFGRQTQTNPLAMRFQAPNVAPLDAAGSAYRVVSLTGEVLAPWTPLTADADGHYTVTLYREDVTGLDTALQARVDVRFRETSGVEKLTSACWQMRALAAPLMVEQAAPSTMPQRTLLPWTLPADSPIALVIGGQIKGHVAEVRVVQQTAEPTTLSIDLTPPTATYTKRVVDDFVQVSQRTTQEECSQLGSCRPQPPADPVDVTTSGTLAPAWSIEVVDEISNTVVCTSATTQLTCQIPARAAGASPRGYRIGAAVSAMPNLSPIAGAADQTLLGKKFIGQVTEQYEYCADLIVDELWGMSWCRDSRMFRRVIALDSAQIAFGQATFHLESITPAEPLGVPLPYLSTTTFTAPARMWDAGDDDLPGPK